MHEGGELANMTLPDSPTCLNGETLATTRKPSCDDCFFKSGNLGAQLRKLEDAQYVAVKKEFAGRKP